MAQKIYLDIVPTIIFPRSINILSETAIAVIMIPPSLVTLIEMK